MKRYIHYIFLLTVGIILNACEDSFPIGGVPSLTNDYDYDYDYPVVREYVDLGLTSGTLWATCNIGAKNPEDYGSYFAWGETTTKSSYKESNYSYSSNPTTLPADRDAARVNWGDSWSMPTTADFKELDKECTWTWTTMNGKNGYKVSSKKNSSYIFLPAAGIYASSSSSSLFLEGSCGYYWSSSLYASNTSYAYVFIFDSRNIDPSYHNSRFDGLSVRPVLRKEVVVTSITLDKTSLSLNEGETATLKATVLPKNATDHSVTWSSSNKSVATVSSDGKVTAVSAGTTTVTVTSVSNTSVKATCTVTVTANSSGLENGHEYVDLGLTSETLWATCNVGATSPDEYGNYYAWGEATTKSSYTESNYNYTSNPSTLPADRDAARVNWGGSWSMPTRKDFEELGEECTWTWTTMNGKNGYKVSSKKNSNYIFLPAAGYFRSSLSLAGSDGYYSSSSLNFTDMSRAHALHFGSSNVSPSNYTYRFIGRSVRPVIRKKTSDEELDDKVFTVSGVTFKMKPVEGGTFQMGVQEIEGPVHSVTLSSYYIGETEVTQELWELVMGSNPSYHKGSSNPVEEISWNDCQEFISKLNAATGQRFRLPTEAEWEYAARGGNKSRGYQYSGSNAIGDVAWYVDNSSRTTHPVKTKQPNELGIYDMSGNVWEWCQDWYEIYNSSSQINPTGPIIGSHRVYRGGGYSDEAWCCMSSLRLNADPDFSFMACGFRLALSE